VNRTCHLPQTSTLIALPPPVCKSSSLQECLDKYQPGSRGCDEDPLEQTNVNYILIQAWESHRPTVMLNRTSEFRESVEEKKKALSEGKRRKLSRPPRRPLADHDGEQNALRSSKEFVAEAYAIVSLIKPPCLHDIMT
jgi:hypothetical protein